MNGKLNIVGINTYVCRFEMVWLSLLDHFLFPSLIVCPLPFSLLFCALPLTYTHILYINSSLCLYLACFIRSLSPFLTFWQTTRFGFPSLLMVVCLYWFSFWSHFDLGSSFNSCAFCFFSFCFFLSFFFLLSLGKHFANLSLVFHLKVTLFVHLRTCSSLLMLVCTGSCWNCIFVISYIYNIYIYTWERLCESIFRPCLFSWIINLAHSLYSALSLVILE